jgi:hypothetical protein
LTGQFRELLVFRAIDGTKNRNHKQRKTMKTLLSTTCAVLVFCQTGQTALILSDLQTNGIGDPSWQSTGQTTQPGWFAEEAAIVTNSTTLALTPTASGLAAGIGATMVSSQNWTSRGGTNPNNRTPVTGTSFDSVVSDLWSSPSMSFSISFTGLTVGANYRIRTWHNDSYLLNQGFAAGGGIVTPSISGGTVVSSANGTVTNLRGAQTDAAFGIADLQFIATISNPLVTYLRTGGDITALPVNGVEFTGPESAAVPEPGQVAASILLLAGIGGYVWLKRRKLKPAGVVEA